MDQPERNQASTAATADLAEMRHAAVLTQTDLAEKADVCIATINMAERGRITPRPTTIRRIATALGCTPREVAAAIAESRRRAVEVPHGA